MTEDELPWEEQKHLYNQCAIPLIITMYAFMAYFVYLMRTNPLRNVWDYTVWVGLPLSVIWPTALFLTFEVLYHRRIRKSATFHMKRFARNMLLVNVGILSSFAVIIICNITLSETLGEKYTFFLGIGIWLILFLPVVLKLGKRHLRKVLEQT